MKFLYLGGLVGCGVVVAGVAGYLLKSTLPAGAGTISPTDHAVLVCQALVQASHTGPLELTGQSVQGMVVTITLGESGDGHSPMTKTCHFDYDQQRDSFHYSAPNIEEVLRPILGDVSRMSDAEKTAAVRASAEAQAIVRDYLNLISVQLEVLPHLRQHPIQPGNTVLKRP